MSVDFDFIIRIGVAGLLGAMIGIEREIRSKEAGLKTHFLVAVGSALIMVVSKYAFSDIVYEEHTSLDPSRIAAQVVSGVGFLGAGTIIIQKQAVKGLTTAAGLWATAGIGLAIGAGMYVVGIGATILVLIGLEIVSRIFKVQFLFPQNITVQMFVNKHEAVQQVLETLQVKGIPILSYEVEASQQGTETVYKIGMQLKNISSEEQNEFIQHMQTLPEVTFIKLKS
ncbi:MULTISPECIES: MgtC/SapB family protein [Bacillus]|uniref:MgtC/SapB family protein n=2 Tax=Bacillus cereus group TaxID=86661 RepID=A0A9W7QAT2_BACCE|nr:MULTISPECIES: MgtC/SapB family protein [Bacillus]AMR03683.1 methyltransferase [Bacillus thuringiensis]ANP82307.1 methyltransferase [Bacillus sp. B25(2016b)]AYF83604.1 MgtC/SapB family protein [Bacillus thuringiensis]EEM82626.1 Membrane protein, MgtC/SapB [Bacillus thuringiensis serovar huazhongensis BGSC 4BD1]KAB2389263.1 MgtC/SapB family protein [Bacillus cereus]